MDNTKKEKIIKNSITNDPYTWSLLIMEDVYQGEIKPNMIYYHDDKFLKEGFPISLICYYLIGKPLQEHEWVYDLLKEELPVGDKKIYTTMYHVEARNSEGFISECQIDRSDAKEIIIDYLKDEICLDDNQVDEIITDLGLKNPVLKPECK